MAREYLKPTLVFHPFPSYYNLFSSMLDKELYSRAQQIDASLATLGDSL
ncbi:MAG: hypothetical protein MPJ24_09405 [Pirellulaceae bacterium]|nr:hypothetical protein [Pirellulaceae bacterium]